MKIILDFLGAGIAVLQPPRWRCVECVIHHERDVREEQHPYKRGAKEQ